MGVAQHLTNTVFIDRALIVQPYAGKGEIPDAATAMSQTSGIALNGSSNSGLISQIVAGVGGTQVISTMDPRLSALGLPQYPPLPANTDPNRVEEIRRTIYVGNLDSKIPADTVLEFFNSIGEVKFVRMAGDESQPTRFAFIEFTDQSTVANALQYNGVTFAGRPLKINHSNNAIVKHPIVKSLPLITQSNDSPAAAPHHHSHHSHHSSSSHHHRSKQHESIDEAMRRVREAESQIAAAIEQPQSKEKERRSSERSAASVTDGDRKRRDKDRDSHSSRHRSRDRDREKEREKTGGSGRDHRDKERDRDRSERHRGSSRRSRSRDREVSGSRRERRPPSPTIRTSPSSSSSHRRKRERSRSRERRSDRRRTEK